MRSGTSALGLVALSCLAALSCGRDEPAGSGGTTTGPLVSFEGSACKKEAAKAAAATAGEARQALAANDVYAGLQCVRWSPIDGGFRVLLLNFEGACGAEWSGRATQNGAALELRLVNPDCRIAACGWCIYDWSFDVKMTAAAGGTDVAIVVDPCPGQQTATSQSVHLPLASTPSGELCRYANPNALGWQAMSLGTCGAAYMPCREGTGMCPLGDGGSPCDDGLTCAKGATGDAAASGNVCHAACAASADCLPAGVMTCDAGLCRPAHGW
jgi:hypothetical protein